MSLICIYNTLKRCRRVAELERLVHERTTDIELVKEEVNHAEVRSLQCVLSASIVAETCPLSASSGFAVLTP